MFTVLWTLGFIANGIPHTERLLDRAEPMERSVCESYIANREDRMADWARGHIGASLDVPVGVRGECRPVELPT